MPLKKWFLQLASCPDCNEGIALHSVEEDENGECITGKVVCIKCGRLYPIKDSIPILHKGLPKTVK